jgi:hypothetical protein
MSEGLYDDRKRALVIRLEAGDTVIERASNYCSTTLNLAHALMHAAIDKDWKITIEARAMESSEYDAIRAKFESEATGEMMALQFESALKAAAEGEQS